MEISLTLVLVILGVIGLFGFFRGVRFGGVLAIVCLAALVAGPTILPGVFGTPTKADAQIGGFTSGDTPGTKPNQLPQSDAATVADPSNCTGLCWFGQQFGNWAYDEGQGRTLGVVTREEGPVGKVVAFLAKLGLVALIIVIVVFALLLVLAWRFLKWFISGGKNTTVTDVSKDNR